ncbi:hypothetical protein G9A89_001519 [Geosiphon pyriformis]|nr:hypothetical protein G9A89_001519 [Geosiphon pyriformis]
MAKSLEWGKLSNVYDSSDLKILSLPTEGRAFQLPTLSVFCSSSALLVKAFLQPPKEILFYFTPHICILFFHCLPQNLPSYTFLCEFLDSKLFDTPPDTQYSFTSFFHFKRVLAKIWIESFHTIPIYNFDASSDSDSESSERFRGGPINENIFAATPSLATPIITSIPSHISENSSNLIVMSHGQLPAPVRPIRSSTMPPPLEHQRRSSDLSLLEESVQTRQSIDEELLFEEDGESEEEVYDPPPTHLITNPHTHYDTNPNLSEVPQRMDGHGLRPLNLLGGGGGGGTGNISTSTNNLEKGLMQAGPNSNDSTPHGSFEQSTKREVDLHGPRRSKDTEHRASSDLLPLTLVSSGPGTAAGGLTFSSNYAYLSPPYGPVISRNQIMSRVSWFSTLVLFNLIYAGYKLIHHSSTSNFTKDNKLNNVVDDGKSSLLNSIFLVIIPLGFLLLYIFFVTVWTYVDIRNKDYDSTFTVLYYSPLMLFSLFFKEKKRVDVSEFHEVNYGAKWWRLGTSRVREGLVMTFYSLLLMGFVISDLVGSAFDQPNGEVSQVFKDFVPVAFMLVVFFLGFVLSIWGVVEALVGGGVHGSGEGRKRLVGVLPSAFKRKGY